MIISHINGARYTDTMNIVDFKTNLDSLTNKLINEYIT